MANFDLSKLEHDFDVVSVDITYDAASANRTTTAWSWTSASNYQSIFTGSGFKFSSGVPTDGTVTALRLNLTTSIFADDLVATGLSLKLSDFSPLADGGTSAFPNDYYWNLVLGGADTINLGNDTTENSLSISFAGDGRFWFLGTGRGANDVINGDVGFGSAAGDFIGIDPGTTVYGGSDKINVTGERNAGIFAESSVSGDTLTLLGSLIGGNDTVTGSGEIIVYGDAEIVDTKGGLRGGNDILTGTIVYGDARGVDGALVGGNDTITGTDAPTGDLLVGDAGGMGSSAVRASGFGGNDMIRGRGGSDIIYGDFQFVDANAIVLYGNDTLYGDAGADEIYGNGGDDLLYGGADADKLYGGDGDDNLWGGAGADQIDGAGGFNLARYDDASWGNLVIRLDAPNLNTGAAAGDIYSGIQGLVGGAGNDTIAGDLDANVLVGQGGNDSLDGKGGADTMRGFTGNDTYYVDSSGDIVDESVAGSNGSDTARSSNLSINLGFTSVFKGTIESAVLEGSASLNLTGNGLVNYLQGNSGNNFINGGAGSDTLVGLGGNDTFRFANSLGSTNIDRINDYNVAQDRIELDNAYFSALANGFLFASAFVANATGLAQDASDRIIYETDTGKLFYDSNGSAAGGTYQQFATLAVGLSMTAGEFFVT